MNLKKVSAVTWSILFLLNLSISTCGQTETTSQAQLPAKEKLYEEAMQIAERFVIRWYETLNLKDLQEEFYVKDMLVWRAILGNGVKGWDFENIKMCDDKSFEKSSFDLIQKAAFAIATYQSLLEEYDVYYYGSSTEERIYPDEIADIGLRIQRILEEEGDELKQLSSTLPSDAPARNCNDNLRRFLTTLVSEVGASSGLFRKHLPPRLPQNEQYKNHLKELITAEVLEEPPDLTDDADLNVLLNYHNPESPLVAQGQLQAVQSKRQLIEVRKGIFSLVFMQENGQLRLVFAMPTRIVD